MNVGVGATVDRDIEVFGAAMCWWRAAGYRRDIAERFEEE